MTTPFLPHPLTERGNTLLLNPDSHGFVAWCGLPNGNFLEVTWEPDNYPGLGVVEVTLTQDKLVEHINSLHGWEIDRCNLPGVRYLDRGGNHTWVAEPDDLPELVKLTTGDT